eukprot:4072023-Karenia_brevis.AAC.1
MQKFQDGKFTFEQRLQYQEWMHFENVCAPQTKSDMNVSLEQDWHDRFAEQRHNDLAYTLEYLVRDGFFAEGISDVEFLAQYRTDVQR